MNVSTLQIAPQMMDRDCTSEANRFWRSGLALKTENTDEDALENNLVYHIELMSEDRRARRVVSRSNCRVTGKYPGFKSRRMHHWESEGERDFFKTLDADPAVQWFQEQPALIRYWLRDESKDHYPDVLVRSTSARTFVEVKTEDDATRDEVVERSQLLARHLPFHGFEYRVVTHEQIRRGVALENANLLLKHGRGAVALEEWEQFRRYLEPRQGESWGVLKRDLIGERGFATACRLVLEGRIHVDRLTRIDDASWVTLRSREDSPRAAS